MTEHLSYDTDYLRWLDDQMQHLRAGSLDQIDREHLLEELKAMSRSERRQLRNRLLVLVMHLLKLRYQPHRRLRCRRQGQHPAQLRRRQARPATLRLRRRPGQTGQISARQPHPHPPARRRARRSAG